MTIQRFVLLLMAWSLGIPLEILIIRALLQGAYRRYPVVFAYVLVTFVTTLVEIPVNAQSFLAHSTAILRQASRVYWMSEWILQLLIFATVLSLIDIAISMARWRRLLRVGMATAALLFAATSFWIHYRPSFANLGTWMTPWTRDLSVCATVLDLGLWMILVAARRSDHRLLLICGALGMQFTAEAIGEAIVNLARLHQEWVALTGSVVAVAGNLICLYIWWQTFRQKPRAVEASPHGSF